MRGRFLNKLNLKEEVLKSLNKPASYGSDIDLSKYDLEKISAIEKTEILDKNILNISQRVGFDEYTLEKASYVQVNGAILTSMKKILEERGALVLPVYEALNKYDWVKRYSWNLINPCKDKYTASVYLYGNEKGYFVYVPKYTKVDIPIYTCLFLNKGKVAQLLHNIVIVDDGGELNLITGCGVPDMPLRSLHIGISEFYIGKNAKLTFSMIHAWSPQMIVRPRASAYVDEGGQFVNYYIIYSPVETIQAYPEAKAKTKSTVYMYSVVAGENNGEYDIGAGAQLEGSNASAEIVSRNLARDTAKIVARARIEGLESATKGHIECLGLVMNEGAKVFSIPEIGSSVKDSILTHEAAIGKISEDQLNYLISKGFSEEEARALIIRGFININIPQLPKSVRETINRITKIIASKSSG